MPYLQNATTFLTQTIIGFVIYLVLLRFWMQWVRADFRNQLGQFVISATNPIVIPLRKFIPSIGTVDTATILIALFIGFLKVFTFFMFASYGTPSVLQYIMMSFGVVVKYSIYILFASIIIQAISSWVNPHSHNPILLVARSISEPIMTPVRRLIPPIGGLDLSPMIMFFFLQFSLKLIVAPLLLGFPI